MWIIKAADLTIPQPATVKITELGTLISAVVGTLLILSALITFIFLILGGIQWITSGGDKTAMEAARNKITHAIVGLVIVGSAWAIMALVQNFLGISVIGSGGINLPKPYTQ
ncbi:hypothetical protein MUP56_02935 [Patescibacteria group bacterium]|nr:hypothetical protein [Patescibacteria group bacterium]